MKIASDGNQKVIDLVLLNPSTEIFSNRKVRPPPPTSPPPPPEKLNQLSVYIPKQKRIYYIKGLGDTEKRQKLVNFWGGVEGGGSKSGSDLTMLCSGWCASVSLGDEN